MAICSDVQGGPMHILFWLDFYLLMKCEAFSHRLQRFYGLDNFHIAQGVLVFGFAYQCLFHYSLFQTLFQVIIFLTAILANKRIANRVRRNLLIGTGTRNEIALFPKPRILILHLLVLAWIIPSSTDKDMFVTAMVIQMYFISCTPLPPSASKVRNFIRSLIRRPVTVPINQTG